MTSKALLKKGNYNKENEGGPLNMLKKVQRTRKEQLDKKISSKIITEPALKENRNITNNGAGHRSKGAGGASSKSGKDQAAKKNEDYRKTFRVRETQKTMLHYAKDMLSELKSKQERYWPKNCLNSHSISPNVRAKMVRKKSKNRKKSKKSS